MNQLSEWEVQIEALLRERDELKEANDNCISLMLHECRMKGLQNQYDELKEENAKLTAEIDRLQQYNDADQLRAAGRGLVSALESISESYYRASEALETHGRIFREGE